VTIGTKYGLVLEVYWYDGMTCTKIGLAPAYRLYKCKLRTERPLVLKTYWYYKITGASDFLVLKYHLHHEMVSAKIGLAPAYYLYKYKVRTKRPLVLRNY
jgi:hypothetical protein